MDIKENADQAHVIDIEVKPSTNQSDDTDQASTETAMELKVIDRFLLFKWNFEQIKAELASRIKKYEGLIVNDENLKDMEDEQKEIASLRIKFDAFRKENKKLMEEPIKQFENEIKELQLLIEQVETPLKEQLQKFEDARADKRENEIRELAKSIAGTRGLRDENFSQFIVLPEWTKRTAKETATTKAVIKAIEQLVEYQKNADEAKLLREQKLEMIEKMCELYSQMLKTPITSEDVAHLTREATLPQIPEIIMGVVNKRIELETKAVTEAQQAQSAPPPVENEGYNDWICPPGCTEQCPADLDSEPCSFGIRTKEVPSDPPQTNGPPVMPISQAGPPVNLPPIYSAGPPITSPAGPVKRYEVLLKLNNATQAEVNILLQILLQRNISHNIVSQVEKGV